MAQNSLEPRDRFYVAPKEAPPSRRPPLREVGWVKWAREHLFGSTADILLTLATLIILILVSWGFFNWVIFEAQWEVVFQNLRTYSVGILFPQSEIWRVDLIIAITVFMTFLSISIWGRMNKALVGTVGIILLVMYLVPPLSNSVPEPLIRTYTQAGSAPRVLAFTANEDQALHFTLDPLTEADDYRITNLKNYVENNNSQGGTSFDVWNERGQQVTLLNQVDPSVYDLNVRVVILHAESGGVIAESDWSEGATDSLTFDWTAPSDDWYAVYVEQSPDAPGENGGAWLISDGIEVFRSTDQSREQLTKTYGSIPEAIPNLTCENCITEVARTNLRYEGKRTFGQFFSLQLSPLLLETRGLFTKLVIVAAFAYLLGKGLLNISFGTAEFLTYLERMMSYVGGSLILLYIGLQLAMIANPLPDLETLSLPIFAALAFTVFLYSAVQFMKPDRGAASRGLTVLWMVSIVVIWIILTGFSNASPDAKLPAIGTQNYGGMLLTLVLSAVAIIASFPLGVLLALGRQSNLPVISLFCTIFIEVIRGVPLITLLFFGRFILPFFGFGLGDVDLVIRIMVMLTFFTAGYMAEVVRGGLQIIPRGQIEASQALGLNGFYTIVYITLPQALRAVIPAIMGQAVSLFKDTSLVYIVGLFEVLGTANQVLGDTQTGYTLFIREGYLYIGIVYFVFAYLMADVSRRIERTGAGSIRRS